MPDIYRKYSTQVDECAGCGKSFNGEEHKTRMFVKKNKTVTNKKSVYVIWCPYCDTRNEIPLKVESGNRTTVQKPMLPKARHRILGTNQYRPRRDRPVLIPPDLEEALVEEKRLREQRLKEEE